MEVDSGDPGDWETRMVGPLGMSSFLLLLQTLSKPALLGTINFLDFSELDFQLSSSQVNSAPQALKTKL